MTAISAAKQPSFLENMRSRISALVEYGTATVRVLKCAPNARLTEKALQILMQHKSGLERATKKLPPAELLALKDGFAGIENLSDDLAEMVIQNGGLIKNPDDDYFHSTLKRAFEVIEKGRIALCSAKSSFFETARLLNSAFAASKLQLRQRISEEFYDPEQRAILENRLKTIDGLTKQIQQTLPRQKSYRRILPPVPLFTDTEPVRRALVIPLMLAAVAAVCIYFAFLKKSPAV
jgi:hypothetical protein